jgi:hypothetical protein
MVLRKQTYIIADKSLEVRLSMRSRLPNSYVVVFECPGGTRADTGRATTCAVDGSACPSPCAAAARTKNVCDAKRKARRARRCAASTREVEGDAVAAVDDELEADEESRDYRPDEHGGPGGPCDGAPRKMMSAKN